MRLMTTMVCRTLGGCPYEASVNLCVIMTTLDAAVYGEMVLS